jgi:MinD-like ATPase involved in chromosome partitioning or flagellar assembly
MPIVAVVGDASTTTTVALASAWPAPDDVVVVEADPSGGDLAAWFDLAESPSLSTVVTRATDGSWAEIDRHTRLAVSGLRLITAPATAVEAQQAVAESARSVVPALAPPRTPVAIVDTGGAVARSGANPFVTHAAVTVMVHRQSPHSARAAAVRLQRFADQVDGCASASGSPVVAVIGGVPFDLDQVEAFLADRVGPLPVVGLPVDELTASVYAGRTGVSARRLARLPLSRAARDLARAVARGLPDRLGSTAWDTR